MPRIGPLGTGGNPTRRAVGSGPVAALPTLLPAPQLLGNCIRVHVTWQPPFNTQHAIPPHPSFSVRPQHALNAFLVTGHLHCWMEAWSRVKALQAAAKVLACTEGRCEQQQAAVSCAVQQSCSHAEAALHNVVALGQACRSLATAAASIPALHSPAAEHHMQIAVQPSLCVLAHRLPRKAARLPLGT